MGGNSDELAGRVKKAAGDLTDDRDLHAEGEVQEVAGKVKNAGEKAGDTVRDKADKLGDAIKR